MLQQSSRCRPAGWSDAQVAFRLIPGLWLVDRAGTGYAVALGRRIGPHLVGTVASRLVSLVTTYSVIRRQTAPYTRLTRSLMPATTDSTVMSGCTYYSRVGRFMKREFQSDISYHRNSPTEI